MFTLIFAYLLMGAFVFESLRVHRLSTGRMTEPWMTFLRCLITWPIILLNNKE